MAGKDEKRSPMSDQGKPTAIEMSQDGAHSGDRHCPDSSGDTGAAKPCTNCDHIYSHVHIDPDRRSKDSDHYNAFLDSQIELPDLNDLIDSPPNFDTLTRSNSGWAFESDGNTVQIEEDSIHSFDTEGDSRSLLLNDTLTEVSDIYASATTCPNSDTDLFTSTTDDLIDPVYEEIPFLRNRDGEIEQPAARCSAVSSDGAICTEDNLVECPLPTAAGGAPKPAVDACAPEVAVRVPRRDVIHQKVTTSSGSGPSSSVESKPRDDTMAFFKRSFAKVRLDLLFRKKKSTKFVECVEKVIEARRSGCIDDDGNIVKTLDEQLKKHAKENGTDKKKSSDVKTTEVKAEKQSGDEGKAETRVVGVANPNYRESYPLPEEDDGSEGYESASEIETVDSTNTSSSSNGGSGGSERSPRLSGILSNRSSHHEDGGDVDGDSNSVARRASSRRVRFSDDVQEFEHIHPQFFEKPERDFGIGHGPRVVVYSQSDDVDRERDNCVLSLTSKISMFENMSRKKDEVEKTHPKLTRTSGFRHSDPGPTRDSMKPDAAEFVIGTDEQGDKVSSITKARVQVFEKLLHMRPEEQRIPRPMPRASLLEIRMNQTKQKIMFFEHLKNGQIIPPTEEE